MHLELRPCPSSDFARTAVVEQRAFKDNTFSPILFPGPFPDNMSEIRAQEMVKELEAEPANRWFKAVDTDAANPDEGIAFSKWQIFTDKLPGPRQNRKFGKGCNVPACEHLFGDLAELRQKYVADKHCIFLQVLVTDPDYARRGAGGTLLKWGTDLADELGIPIYLESSLSGHPLYLKYGFKDVEIHEMDLSQYGAPPEMELHRVYIMMYEPQMKQVNGQS